MLVESCPKALSKHVAGRAHIIPALHDHRGRHPCGSGRNHCASGSGWDGRGLQGPRYAPAARRRDQGPAAAVCLRPRAHGAVRARSPGPGGAESSEHGPDSRRRGEHGRLRAGDGARGRSDAREPDRAPAPGQRVGGAVERRPGHRRARHRGSSPTPSRPLTIAASFTATSSRRTSWSAAMAR